jgi:hypothetical protein
MDRTRDQGGQEMRQIQTGKIKSPIVVDPGPAPMLQWIKIDDLVVDDRYQRDLKIGNWTAIQRIASTFKWSRFSSVFVAPVEGGKFAIIDGQHRTHAAAICGFAEVPCQVVQMTLQEQAASFAAVNGLVTKVTIWQIYKAALAAGEDWAVKCHQVCVNAGCSLMTGNNATDFKGAGEIYAIGLIRSYVEKGKAKLLTFMLKSLRASQGGGDAAVWSNEVLKPMMAAVVDRPWLMRQNVNLAAFFDEFDIWAAIDKADEIVKTKRRQGNTGVSRYDFAAAMIGDALDKAFPQRMALPSRSPKLAVPA